MTISAFPLSLSFASISYSIFLILDTHFGEEIPQRRTDPQDLNFLHVEADDLEISTALTASLVEEACQSCYIKLLLTPA